MKPSITVRPAADGDEALLREVYAGTRAEEMAIVPWSSEEKSAFLDMQFNAQRTSYESRFPDSEHSIVLAGGDPVGRIWIDRRDDEIRLIDIALLLRRQNEGIGTTLLKRLQADARDVSKPVRHSVHQTNTKALRFYERLGFTFVEKFGTHVLMEWVPEEGGDR